MNNSNAAAKARRAGIKPSVPPTPAPGPAAASAAGTNGLTLPQVISVIDRRLVTLESFMKETKENPIIMATNTSDEEGAEAPGVIVPSEFNAFVDEINNRFQLLAEEIETMKNALLKLQTFTMDVNKILLEKTNIVVPESATEAVVPLTVTETPVDETPAEAPASDSEDVAI
jgi:hypothetical protein